MLCYKSLTQKCARRTWVSSGNFKLRLLTTTLHQRSFYTYIPTGGTDLCVHALRNSAVYVSNTEMLLVSRLIFLVARSARTRGPGAVTLRAQIIAMCSCIPQQHETCLTFGTKSWMSSTNAVSVSKQVMVITDLKLVLEHVWNTATIRGPRAITSQAWITVDLRRDQGCHTSLL